MIRVYPTKLEADRLVSSIYPYKKKVMALVAFTLPPSIFGMVFLPDLLRYLIIIASVVAATVVLVLNYIRRKPLLSGEIAFYLTPCASLSQIDIDGSLRCLCTFLKEGVEKTALIFDVEHYATLHVGDEVLVCEFESDEYDYCAFCAVYIGTGE
jgi:positive regulator of sigma E activity